MRKLLIVTLIAGLLILAYEMKHDSSQENKILTGTESRDELIKKDTTEYRKYLQLFNDSLLRTNAKSIDFSETLLLQVVMTHPQMQDIIGACKEGGLKRGGLTAFYINEKLIRTVDESVIILMIFHEIGHCFLGLKHEDFKAAPIMLEKIPHEFEPLALTSRGRDLLVQGMLNASQYNNLK